MHRRAGLVMGGKELRGSTDCDDGAGDDVDSGGDDGVALAAALTSATPAAPVIAVAKEAVAEEGVVLLLLGLELEEEEEEEEGQEEEQEEQDECMAKCSVAKDEASADFFKNICTSSTSGRLSCRFHESAITADIVTAWASSSVLSITVHV